MELCKQIVGAQESVKKKLLFEKPEETLDELLDSLNARAKKIELDK